MTPECHVPSAKNTHRDILDDFLRCSLRNLTSGNTSNAYGVIWSRWRSLRIRDDDEKRSGERTGSSVRTVAGAS